jgi:hypothetical protein
MVICHEPPSPSLLPNEAEVRAAMEDVCDTYAAEGLFPAMEKFMTMAGIRGGPQGGSEGEPSPEQQEAMAQMMKNLEFFLSRYVRNVGRYEPDFDALKACTCKIVAAVGEDSEGQVAHNGGLGLARRLGTRPVVFPGDHSGFDGKPVEFSARLLEVLAG